MCFAANPGVCQLQQRRYGPAVGHNGRVAMGRFTGPYIHQYTGDWGRHDGDHICGRFRLQLRPRGTDCVLLQEGQSGLTQGFAVGLTNLPDHDGNICCIGAVMLCVLCDCYIYLNFCSYRIGIGYLK